MKFRRHPDPERVRETLREITLRHYGEEIVRLRGAVAKARYALDRGEVLAAKNLLDDALEEKLV